MKPLVLIGKLAPRLRGRPTLPARLVRGIEEGWFAKAKRAPGPARRFKPLLRSSDEVLRDDRED